MNVQNLLETLKKYADYVVAFFVFVTIIGAGLDMKADIKSHVPESEIKETYVTKEAVSESLKELKQLILSNREAGEEGRKDLYDKIYDLNKNN